MGFCITGTGTLFEGGDVIPLGRRLQIAHEAQFKRLGFDIRKNPKGFSDRYGRNRKVQKVREWMRQDGTMTESKSEWKVESCPGFAPPLINQFLNNTAIVKMMDMVADMPPYSEILTEIEPGQILDPYNDAEKAFMEVIEEIREEEKDLDPEERTSLSSSLLQLLLTYPERIYEGMDIKRPFSEDVIFHAPSLEELGLPTHELLPKETEFLELAQQELAEKRKMFLLIESSGKTDITPRLLWMLDQSGIRAKKMEKDTTKTRSRLIDTWLKEGYDIIATNPKKIETGLDLLDTPTIVFYQQPLSALVLRQASRRAWRVIQKMACKTYYFTYSYTWQNQMMLLLKQKLEAALALEGDLSESGLAALGGDDTVSIAKELSRMMRKGGRKEQENLRESWAQMREKEVKQSLSQVDVSEWESAVIPLKGRFHFGTPVGQQTFSAEKKVKLVKQRTHTIIEHHQKVMENVMFDVMTYETRKNGRKVRTTTKMTVEQLEKQSGKQVAAQGCLFDF